MSAIASFIKMPKSALGGLRIAAVPQKRFFGGTKDGYHDYLSKHGSEVAQYAWSGYVLATLLPYLKEKQNIDLMQSEYGDLATFLTQSRNASHFIFTQAQSDSFLNRLDASLFSEAELQQYFNEFNETNEKEMGRAMIDGIAAFHESLAQLDGNSVVVFSIG